MQQDAINSYCTSKCWSAWENMNERVYGSTEKPTNQHTELPWQREPSNLRRTQKPIVWNSVSRTVRQQMQVHNSTRAEGTISAERLYGIEWEHNSKRSWCDNQCRAKWCYQPLGAVSPLFLQVAVSLHCRLQLEGVVFLICFCLFYQMYVHLYDF